MADGQRNEKAATPEDIPRLFARFVGDGDFGALATLYEPDAVLAIPADHPTRGNTAIAEVFRARFDQVSFDGSAGEVQPALQCGDLALTSTRLPDGRVTAEIARRQQDGSWRWVIDQPQM